MTSKNRYASVAIDENLSRSDETLIEPESKQNIKLIHHTSFDQIEWNDDTKTTMSSSDTRLTKLTSNFNCKECGYSSTYKTTFDRHVKSRHSKTKDFVCEECNFSSCRKDNLLSHINNMHTSKLK